MANRVVTPILITRPGTSPPPSVAERVERLEHLTRLMDEAFPLPFLRTQIGLDALIGLVPGLGDLVSAGIAAWVVREARQLGAPKWLIARMAWNIGVDFVGGAVPLAGDLFDVYFKANRRNLTLLKKWLRKQGHSLHETADRS